MNRKIMERFDSVCMDKLGKCDKVMELSDLNVRK